VQHHAKLLPAEDVSQLHAAGLPMRRTGKTARELTSWDIIGHDGMRARDAYKTGELSEAKDWLRAAM
jgi:hypothetical protein